MLRYLRVLRCRRVFISAPRSYRDQCLCEQMDRRKGKSPQWPRLSGFDARNRKCGWPIIICNRERKGESETGMAASTTGYCIDCQVPRRCNTLICGFVHTVFAWLNNKRRFMISQICYSSYGFFWKLYLNCLALDQSYFLLHFITLQLAFVAFYYATL